MAGWNRYYFTNGPTELYCGLKIRGYTELNGGSDINYETNLSSINTNNTFHTERVTNNINLHIIRSTNWFENTTIGRSVTAFDAPVIVKWVRMTGSTNMYHVPGYPPVSDSASEFYAAFASPTNSEIAYNWIDMSSGNGAGATITIAHPSNQLWPFGLINIHHNLIENPESDVLICGGGVDFHHNIIRNRYKYQNGGCNDTLVFNGNTDNIRVFNNIIEPGQNSLYYCWGLSTNLCNFFFYNNLLIPVRNELRWGLRPNGGSGTMEQHRSTSGTNYCLSNIVFVHNTWVGTTNGGNDSMISLVSKNGLPNEFFLQDGSFVIKNNLFVQVDTNTIPTLPIPVKLGVYGYANLYGTNDLGYGWTYTSNSIILDNNVFASYRSNNLCAANWGQSRVLRTYLTNATQIAAVTGYTNNVSCVEEIFNDATIYDYRPASATVNIGSDLTAEDYSDLMPCLLTDLYGVDRTLWSVGAMEQDSGGITNIQIYNRAVDISMYAGSNACFTVFAMGDTPISYQWYKDDASIDGATLSYLFLTNVTTSSSGDYYLSLSNGYGAISGPIATLSVTSTNIGEEPVILTQPIESYTNAAGSSITLSVIATGAVPLSYLWYSNNIATTVSTTSYALSNCLTNYSADYFVVVTNAYGAVTSTVSIVSITNSSLLLHLTFEDDFAANGYAEDYSGNQARMLRYGWGASTTNFPTRSGGKIDRYAALFEPYYDTKPWGEEPYPFFIGQYGAITNLGRLNTITQATLCVWVKWANVTNLDDIGKHHTGTLLSSGYGEPGSWYWGRYYHGYPTFFISTNTSGLTDSWQLNWPNPSTYYYYTNNAWIHFAITVDCSISTNLNSIIYTDGVASSTNTLALQPENAVECLKGVDIQGATYGPWIAVGVQHHNATPPLDDADELPNAGWLNGSIDDVRIYNRVLTLSEIRSLTIYYPPFSFRRFKGAGQ